MHRIGRQRESEVAQKAMVAVKGMAVVSAEHKPMVGEDWREGTVKGRVREDVRRESKGTPRRINTTERIGNIRVCEEREKERAGEKKDV